MELGKYMEHEIIWNLTLRLIKRAENDLPPPVLFSVSFVSALESDSFYVVVDIGVTPPPPRQWVFTLWIVIGNCFNEVAVAHIEPLFTG